MCGLFLQSKITDMEGRDFDAMTVFSYSIDYMKRKIIEIVSENFPALTEEDVHYVLTTSAILSEPAKQFMRKAARNAHIPDERLRLALEPECAAIYEYTKELPALDTISQSKKATKTQTCHVIIDLGGGTLDIAAYRVIGDCKFEEIIVPDGGAFGVDNINMKFERFLLNIMGGPAFTKFKDKNMEDYLIIQRSFENKICALTDKGDDAKVTLSVPESLRKLHEKHKSEKLSESVHQMSYADDVEFKADKMRIKIKLFRSFLTETVDGIIETVENVLLKIPAKIDTIICVDGFADCDILKKAFRDRFPKKKIIIPKESVTSIMKGAIIFGRDQSVVNNRKSRHTYGLNWNEDFDLKVHGLQKREDTDDGHVCRDIFRKIIGKGETVLYNKPTQEIDTYVKSKYQKIDKTWKTKVLVAAIDFGTTYSGFALSFRTDYEKDKTNIFTSMWTSGDNDCTHKTPTCLLLKPDKMFHSFGYDAEQKYAELAEDDSHKDWHFFSRFKMKLYEPSYRNECGLSLHSKIKDMEGRDFDAMTVFSYSIDYMKRKIIEVVYEMFPRVIEKDIHYVLPTPAIWREPAKQFMRKAARNAQIPDERLRIAPEPECAAVYVYTKELPALETMLQSKKATKTGTCHVIIDVGGGTLDIAAHRVIGDCQFEDIIAPDGGAFGGDIVNMKFEQFLLKITGGPAFAEFKDKYMVDYLLLQRNFEKKKCAFTDKRYDEEVTLLVPESFRKLHEEHNREKLSESVRQMIYADEVKFTSDKMRMKTKLFRSFFTETVAGIIETVENVLLKIPEKIDTIICVGGFADCDILKKAFRDRFPNQKIIIPKGSVTSIMKGAIIFGRDPSVVNKRISRHTNCLDWNEDFDPKMHDLQKREETDDGHVCRDIFRNIVGTGETLTYNKPTLEIDVYVKSKYQEVIDFSFYRSEILTSPRYVDELGCHLIGTMTVNIGQKSVKGLDRCVKLKVYFGATELRAEAEDDTGKKYEVTFKLEETHA